MERANLPWLPPAPADFRVLLKALDALAHPLEEMVRLASCALDANQLHALNTRLARLASNAAGPLDGLVPIRVAMLSNATTTLLTPCLAATGLRFGFHVTPIEADYDQLLQQAADPAAAIHGADVVIVALDYRALPELSDEFSEHETEAVDRAIDFVNAMTNGLRANGRARLVVQTVARPPAQLFGNADAVIEGSRTRRIARFNQRLIDAAANAHDIILDVAGLADAVGLDQWFDDVQWHVGKFAFHQRFVPLYADHCMRLIAAAYGRVGKCLVLDLDNTIWGGVIGDDLLDGIVLGHGSAAGEAFLAVQRMALALRRRGVLIAVCSKNDEHVAREPFRSHPDMLLREEHIAAFVANWDDKPANLQLIARTLDIGIESLVFVDDNPVEREQVRQRLPQVAVPELPADPALFPAMISAGGYFEATSFTPDDRERAARYSAGAARAVAAARYGDVNDFLASLDMAIAFAPFDSVGRSRIAQLILRSNQFNLTTQRYSEADVAQWEENPAAFTLQVRLTDRFGDNGVISVVICRTGNPIWTIDTWLMSCRVLNRRVEEAVLDEIVAAARAAGASSLLGVFRPTDRNGIVKQHYAKLGFALVARDNESERWQLDVMSYQPKRPPMRILSQ